MELKALLGFVTILVLVSLVAGIGVLTLDKMSVAVKGIGVIKSTENVTFTNGAGTTAYDELLTLTGCYDATNKSAITVSAAGCRITNADLGTLAIPATQGTPVKVQVNYTFSSDSPASTATDYGRNAVADVPEDWLSLVVTIGILSLILGMVIIGYAKLM